MKGFISRFVRSSPAAAAVPYALGILMIIYYYAAGAERAYLVCGMIMTVTAVLVQGGYMLYQFINGNKNEISDMDREIIGKSFSMGAKKRKFRDGFAKFERNEYSEALEEFRELKNDKLTDNEQGVLSFYTSVCYARMGYPTNAGHCAAEAADKGVCVPESLLLAGRNFAQAGSYTTAVEYYEKLVPIITEKRMFPFVFNELGKVYLSANDPKNSRTYFEKSISYGIDAVTSQGGLALVSLLEGKEEEACERYRLALIARISDSEGFRKFCSEICVANGYPEDFFEKGLRDKYCREKIKQ